MISAGNDADEIPAGSSAVGTGDLDGASPGQPVADVALPSRRISEALFDLDPPGVCRGDLTIGGVELDLKVHVLRPHHSDGFPAGGTELEILQRQRDLRAGQDQNYYEEFSHHGSLQLKLPEILAFREGSFRHVEGDDSLALAGSQSPAHPVILIEER